MTNAAKCRLYKVYSFAAYLFPMTLLFALNHEIYDSDGGFFGFFGYIMLGLVFVAFKKSILACIKDRTLMTVSLILFVASVFMHYLAEQMILISAVSLGGSVLQNVFERVADVYEMRATVVVDGEKRRNLKRAIPDRQAWREAYGVAEKGLDSEKEL